MTFFSLTDTIEHLNTVCPHHCNSNECVRSNSIQEDLTKCTLSWFGHSYVSECLIH